MLDQSARATWRAREAYPSLYPAILSVEGGGIVQNLPPPPSPRLVDADAPEAYAEVVSTLRVRCSTMHAFRIRRGKLIFRAERKTNLSGRSKLVNLLTMAENSVRRNLGFHPAIA